MWRRWILALTLVVLAYYWKIVFTKQFAVLWQWEMVSQYYSWYTYAAIWIHKGIVPLWDPFRYGGNSFIGEMQNGLFYPFKLFLYLAPLDSNGFLSERVFNLFYVFSHWLAAVWMFLLARHLKLSYLAALVAGICFGLGGFVQWTAWPNILDAMPWLPLIVLFVLRAFDSVQFSKALTNAGIAGLALGMTFLAGSLHIAIMDGIVVATLALFLWSSNRPSRSILWPIMIVAVIAAVSFLFGAVQLLPSYEYSPLAYRWVGGDSPIKPFERIPYPILATTAFGPQSLFSFIFSEVHSGKSDFSTYFGVLPLVLVIVGAWRYWREPLVRYLAALAVLAWIYTWASFSLLHGILYLVPHLDIAREADRFIYLTDFAMAMLAGYGVQLMFVDRDLDAFSSLTKFFSVFKWIIIGFGVLVVAANMHFPIAVTDKTYLSFFFLATAYALLMFVQRARQIRGAQIALVFLITWDLYSFNWLIQSKAEMRKQNADALAQLVSDNKLAEFIKAQPGMARVHFDMENPPNIGDTYGVPVTLAMAATLLTDFSAGYGSAWQRDLLGVRYTIRPTAAKVDAPSVYTDDLWRVYENPNALPRAWIVHRVEIDASGQRPPRRVMEPDFDLKRIVVLNHPLDNPLEDIAPHTIDAVRTISYEPNQLELEATTDSAGLLVVGEVYYPGWKAFVDGSAAKLYQADGLVRAVPILQGTHRVSLRYQPDSVRWGAILTILTFILVCGGACYTLRPLS